MVQAAKIIYGWIEYIEANFNVFVRHNIYI